MQQTKQLETSPERRLLRWVLVICLSAVVVVVTAGWVAAFLFGPAQNGFVKEQIVGIVGIPAAASLAAIIVVMFRQTEGPIEFEAVFLKLKGAGGPVVLWVLCFLSIVGSIKLLWK